MRASLHRPSKGVGGSEAELRDRTVMSQPGSPSLLVLLYFRREAPHHFMSPRVIPGKFIIRSKQTTGEGS